MAGRWEHYPHEADIGVRGFGASLGEAFAQAALAMTGAVADPAAVAPREPVEIRFFESGGDAVVEVADRGCGMTDEFVRTRLFQPFVSTKESGFGIGAYEARALIAAMGGRLEVESAPGEGTRFTIILPGAEAVAAPHHHERMRA